MMNANKPNINEKIEFKPGRKPKEAIEGDMIRFMYNDYENGSVSWLQGRLVSRIDDLEEAVESEWMRNRFKVDTISTIRHWGSPETPPASTMVNVSYCTDWVLGIQGDCTDDVQNKKICLGYHEAAYMNLVGREHRSGRSNEDGALTMYHTYEVSLLAPGEGPTVFNEGNFQTYEPEEMMKKEQQTPAAVLSNEETGTLSLITYKKIIRRAYLNNKMIPTEIDTCSLV